MYDSYMQVDFEAKRFAFAPPLQPIRKQRAQRAQRAITGQVSIVLHAAAQLDFASRKELFEKLLECPGNSPGKTWLSSEILGTYMYIPSPEENASFKWDNDDKPVDRMGLFSIKPISCIIMPHCTSLFPETKAMLFWYSTVVESRCEAAQRGGWRLGEVCATAGRQLFTSPLGGLLPCSSEGGQGLGKPWFKMFNVHRLVDLIFKKSALERNLDCQVAH